MDEQKFWMVWDPQRDIPAFRHDTKASAVVEAERLARLNGGRSFYVLEAITGRRVDIMQTINLEIPF